MYEMFVFEFVGGVHGEATRGTWRSLDGDRSRGQLP